MLGVGTVIFEGALNDYSLDVSYLNAKSGHFMRKFVGHTHYVVLPVFFSNDARFVDACRKETLVYN